MLYFSDSLISAIQGSTERIWYADRQLKKLNLYILSDCDGILTDGKSTYTKSGKISKTYGSHDKEALTLCKNLEIPVEFITSDQLGLDIHKARIETDLGAKLSVCKGNFDRARYVNDLQKQGFTVIFLGDSMSDIMGARKADYFGTTASCFYMVKNILTEDNCNPDKYYFSKCPGGEGGFADCVYNILDRCLKNINNS